MILAAKNAFCLKIQNIAGGILPMKIIIGLVGISHFPNKH